MSDELSFATSLMGKKAQLLPGAHPGFPQGSPGEIVCINPDKGGNLKYTLLLDDGSLVAVHHDQLKISK